VDDKQYPRNAAARQMAAQKGEDDPIAEMPIESYKYPLFIDSLPEDLSVIGSRLADFRGAHHIEPRGP
jgi:hypothetical protein